MRQRINSAVLWLHPQLQVGPLRCGIQIVHVLTTIAAVDALLPQLRVLVRHASAIQLPLNGSTVAIQHGRDVPWGDPPTGHPLNHNALTSSQVLALPAILSLFHAVPLPLLVL